MLNKIILDERSQYCFICSKSGPVGRGQGKPVRQRQVPQGTFLPVAYLTGFALLAGKGKNAAALYQCVSDSFE